MSRDVEGPERGSVYVYDFGGCAISGGISLVPQSLITQCLIDQRSDECSDVQELNCRIVAAASPGVAVSHSETSWTSHNFNRPLYPLLQPHPSSLPPPSPALPLPYIFGSHSLHSPAPQQPILTRKAPSYGRHIYGYRGPFARHAHST